MAVRALSIPTPRSTKPTHEPVWSTLLRTGLNAGSQAVGQYAAYKNAETTEQGKVDKWIQLGFSPEAAQAISMLPPDAQAQVLMQYLQDPSATLEGSKQIGAVEAHQQAPQQAPPGVIFPEQAAATSPLSQLTAPPQAPQNQAPQTAAPQVPPEQAAAEQTTPLGLLSNAAQATGVMPKATPQQLQPLAGLAAQQPAGAPGTQEALQGLQQAVAGAPQAIQAPETNVLAGKTSQPAKPATKNPFANLGKKPAEILAEKRLELSKEQKEETATAKERARIDKETKPIYDAISKEAVAAKKGNVRLNHMEKLVESGKLNAPSTVIIRNAFKAIPFTHEAIDLTSLLTPETQQFEKLTYEFLNDLKDVFGSRISNLEVTNFLKRVPNLVQSDKGKISVLNSLRSVNNAAIIRKKVADKIIDANGGERPRDLEQQVETQAAPELNALASEFKGGLVGL